MSNNETHLRRSRLQKFARTVLTTNPNKCEGLVDVVKFSGQLVVKDKSPADLMMEDLMLVLIGEGLTKRGTGKYFYMQQKGDFSKSRGSCGFKPELKDTSVQVSPMQLGVSTWATTTWAWWNR